MKEALGKLTESLKDAQDARNTLVLKWGKLLCKTERLQAEVNKYKKALKDSPVHADMDALTFQVNLLKAKLAAYRWIPVEERLPEKTKEDLRPKYLIYNKDGIAVQEWRHYDFGWDFDDDTGKPTHWVDGIILPEEEPKKSL